MVLVWYGMVWYNSAKIGLGGYMLLYVAASRRGRRRQTNKQTLTLTLTPTSTGITTTIRVAILQFDGPVRARAATIISFSCTIATTTTT